MQKGETEKYVCHHGKAKVFEDIKLQRRIL